MSDQDWREELVGTVKQQVPMTTGDARRVINLVLDAISARYRVEAEPSEGCNYCGGPLEDCQGVHEW